MTSKNIIKFQLKVTVIKLWIEERPIEQISQTFGISLQTIISIVGQTRIIALYFFNEGWTDPMVTITLSLSLQTVSTMRWTLQNVINFCGQPGVGSHVKELNNRQYWRATMDGPREE